MKKFLIATLVTMVALGFLVAPAFAQGGMSDPSMSKTANANANANAPMPANAPLSKSANEAPLTKGGTDTSGLSIPSGGGSGTGGATTAGTGGATTAGTGGATTAGTSGTTMNNPPSGTGTSGTTMNNPPSGTGTSGTTMNNPPSGTGTSGAAGGST